MELTEDNVAKLPSDGSFFSSYFPSTNSPTPVPENPPDVRISWSKTVIGHIMHALRQLGPEGRRILDEDELYFAKKHDIRFRNSENHMQDMDNPDYWEAKEKYLEEKYKLLHAELHPVNPFSPDSSDICAIPQAEMDRMCYREERRRRRTEAWVSSISQELQEYPRIVDSPVSHRSEPPSTTTCPVDKDQLPSLQLPAQPEDAVATVEPETRTTKRKRSRMEIEDEDDSHAHISKRSVQARLSRETPSTTIIEPARKRRTAKKATLPTSPSRPITLRRSARIAALPKIKYPK
ncbi:hypothetical protein F5B22DRAFT_653884 [Xylaria bambusicola]|uniref:uncharacterized protein n=1 Tax=Xylaria bambusicola TaxID=326684 RepID=UPI0020073C30|nr:uncharacterized protein F5B22DRAFT_653884 [Xylaria bambusicola]KAI0502739.1 hypothetical protein F5B22DRAFT_653884 [Xylaria bambusicola]